MTLQEIIQKYQQIEKILLAKYPIPDKEKRVFAYITKMVEEFGELAEVSLAKANLQRNSKNLTEVDERFASEFADVFSALLLLGLESGVDIEGAIAQKIEFTLKRLKQEGIMDQ